MTASDSFAILPDPPALARAGAARFAQLADESIRARGRFVVVLAGGSTPKAMHELLASPTGPKVDWPNVHVFFGDERCVPPDDPRSNYNAAHQALLAHVPIPPAQVHRIEGELDPRTAAVRYHMLLCADSDNDNSDSLFDLVYLGMGADGHTLSLFPGHDFKADKLDLATAAVAPPESPVRDRVSLTLLAVEEARHAIFMIAGQDKARAFAAVRDSRPTGRPDLPASLINCRSGVAWLVDRAAAELPR